MAMFHMHVKMHGRSKGQSAIACAAYRSGEKLYDEELGIYSDFSRKGGVVHSEILLCENAPESFLNREVLWNEVMKIEKASNAQFAREFEIGLPREFALEQSREVLLEFFKPLVEQGMCIDFSIHDKGDGNPHCHALATTRPIKSDGTWGVKEKKQYLLDEHGERIPIMDPTTGMQKVDSRNRKQWKRGLVETTGWNDRNNVEKWRKAWADICNQHLSEKDKMDHRSYERQGIDRLPTSHEGYVARDMEKKGKVSERCQNNRVIRSMNRLKEMLETKVTEFKKRLSEMKEKLIEMGVDISERTVGMVWGADRSDRGTAGDHFNHDRKNETDESGIQDTVKGTGTDERGAGTGAHSVKEMVRIGLQVELRKRRIAETESGIARLKEELAERKELSEWFYRLKGRNSARRNGEHGEGNLSPGRGEQTVEAGERRRAEELGEMERISRAIEQREQYRERGEVKKKRSRSYEPER